MYKINNPGWDMYGRMHSPMEDVARFMHGCDQDPPNRVMSTTALVLALCQVAGPAMISQPPGFLLINAGDNPADPIDAVMKTLTGSVEPKPRPQPEDYERNRKTMKAAIAQKQALANKTMFDFFGIPEPGGCPLAKTFHSAMVSNHGGGRAGWYADRRDPEFGWFTDATGHTILRLDRDDDRSRFREDLRQHPKRLVHPVGYGARMREETKQLSIAGSFPVADWDNHMAAGIIRNALPVLFLPHSVSQPHMASGDKALEWIGVVLAVEAEGAPAEPVKACQRFDPVKVPWLKQRLARVRERLRHIPADYEFFILRTMREMLPCCSRLAGILAPSGAPEEEQVNFGFDLFSHVLQGLCLSVEALGWHGYGFECPDPERRVLRAVREHGSLSKRDLQRHQQWLTAELRDGILDAMVAEGLVGITGNEITAIPFADYWQHILRRSFGEMPEVRWKRGVPSRESAA